MSESRPTDTQPRERTPRPDTPVDAAEQARLKMHQILLGIGLLAAIGVAAWIYLSERPQSTAVSRATDYQRSCQRIASDTPRLIEDRLKTPSAARFNERPQAFYENGICSVRSWVDAPNSAGAMIRTYFTVHLTPNADGTWKVTDVKTGE